MKIIDLTHDIQADMPVYPGTPQPVITVEYSYETTGCIERRLDIFSHVGTHIDAPAHIIPEGGNLSSLCADRFVGYGMVLDFSGHPCQVIKSEDIRTRLHDMESASSDPRTSISGRAGHELNEAMDFLLLNTGWSRFWGTAGYFRDYPVLSIEAAEFLASINLKGVGVDAVSVDPVGASLSVHHKLLSKETVIIENLTNLDSLPKSGFLFSCLPLKIKNGEGSPVRAVAILL